MGDRAEAGGQHLFPGSLSVATLTETLKGKAGGSPWNPATRTVPECAALPQGSSLWETLVSPKGVTRSRHPPRLLRPPAWTRDVTSGEKHNQGAGGLPSPQRPTNGRACSAARLPHAAEKR